MAQLLAKVLRQLQGHVLRWPIGLFHISIILLLPLHLLLVVKGWTWSRWLCTKRNLLVFGRASSRFLLEKLGYRLLGVILSFKLFLPFESPFNFALSKCVFADQAGRWLAAGDSWVIRQWTNSWIMLMDLRRPRLIFIWRFDLSVSILCLALLGFLIWCWLRFVWDTGLCLRPGVIWAHLWRACIRQAPLCTVSTLGCKCRC